MKLSAIVRRSKNQNNLVSYSGLVDTVRIPSNNNETLNITSNKPLKKEGEKGLFEKFETQLRLKFLKQRDLV